MRVVHTPFRTAVAALIVALAFSVPVAANAPALGQTSGIAIENFGRVSDVYYRGAQPVGQDYNDLRAIGVKTIIDLTEESGKAAPAEQAGLKFIQISMSSTTPPSKAQVDQFLAIVNDPDNQPVYVHCKGGRHRTGTLTAVYRITNDGWSPDRAFAEMMKYDFGYGFGHGNQKKFVYSYAAQVDRTRAAAAVKATSQQ